MAGDETPRQKSLDGADRAHRVIDIVDEWLFSESMSSLLALFSQEPPADAAATGPAVADSPLRGYNEALPEWVHGASTDTTVQQAGLSVKQLDLLRRTLAFEQAAADSFNFRARGKGEYVERAQAEIATFSSAESERIIALTGELGLVTPQPPQHMAYPTTLILGGGYSRPLLRARQALKIHATGVDLGRLAFLGSGRRLIDQPAERPIAEEYAPGASDEFDLLIGAAHTVFGFRPGPPRFLCGCASANDVCPRWRLRHTDFDAEIPATYTHERVANLADDRDQPAGLVLSASTGRPPHRPNTADTLELWARSARARDDERLLAVTSQYFVPFQTFDCLRLLWLPLGLETDVVGFNDAPPRPGTLPGYLLMETLSAIRSARRLLVAALETLSHARTRTRD